MTFAQIGKAVLALVLGVCLLASIVAFVPGPYLVLAVIVALPIESALLAAATAPRRATDRTSRASFGL